jgi:hypothetical protein
MFSARSIWKTPTVVLNMQITWQRNKMKAPAFTYYMHEGPAAFSIEVAGALAAEGAKKLERDWLSASAAIAKKELVVDLSFVTEIDPVGRQLLLRWRGNGATLVANTPESRALAESVVGLPLRPSARIAFTSKPYRSESFFRDVLTIVGLLVLLIPASVSAEPLAIVQPTAPPQSIAFARYIAWLDARDLFTESGPVALAIAASLPGLDKQGSLLAIREVGESERSQYRILEREGDDIVFERAIAPYFVAQRQAEDLPRSSVSITPRNYRFCYVGTVEAGDAAAYIFRITPKKNRAGLIRGELWIDPVTGAPVLVTGHLVEAYSPSIRSIKVARELTLLNGYPSARTTHMMIEPRPVGRAELTIIEFPLGLAEPGAAPPLTSERSRK